MKPKYASGGSGNYDLIVAAFVGMLLISNIGATKLIGIGPLIFDGGALLFPLTYILGDVLAEVYGLKRANRAIFIGFSLSLLMSLSFLAVASAPPAADWKNQDAWAAVLGFVPNIVVASLIAYLTGQMLNAFVLVKLKERTTEKHLWLRLISSSIVGELADTIVFCAIAFGPLAPILGQPALPWAAFLNYVLVGWAYKMTIEILFLPVTYRVIAATKAREPDYG